MVEPYSHEAYRESIQCALNVVRAQGLRKVVFSTGKSSEQRARSLITGLPEAAFVPARAHALRHAEAQLRMCAGRIAHQMAGGAACTHCRSSEVDLQLLAEAAASAEMSRGILDRIRKANTVRHAFGLLPPGAVETVCARLIDDVKSRVKEQLGTSVRMQMIVWPFERGTPLCVR